MSKHVTPIEFAALTRMHFHTFMVRCFNELNPQTRFLPNWHNEVIAAYLEMCWQGKIKRLVINLPPRHLKSHIASIALPAFLLGHNPSTQIINATYGQDLSDKFARDQRTIMSTAWYKQVFPTARLARQSLEEIATTNGGFRLATSVGGVLTGRGGDFIIIDDPLKPEDAISDGRRKGCNDWFDHTLYSRLNDKQNGCIIIVMQRLHEDDLVGHVLAREGWTVLRLPAIAEEDEEYVIDTIFGQQRFSRRPGDLLHPEREPQSILDQIRQRLGRIILPGNISRHPPHLGAAW